MDISRFTDAKPGILIPIKTPEGPDWAFIPNHLPPSNWRLPDNLINMSMEAWDCLGTLNGIGRTLPNPELLLRPLQEREAIQSSKLEGTYTTPEEVLLFAKNPSIPKSESDPANAWREVFNYNNSLAAGYRHLKNRPFTLNMIRELHHNLLSAVRGREKTPGEFRKLQVGIGSDYRFIPPPPQQLPALLDALEKHINQPMDKRDRLIQAFQTHYQFETIHPFMDGNGRVGRLLLALMLYKLCDHDMPWLYLSPFFERYKDEYISKLFRVSTHGDWSDWIDFCLRGTIASTKDAVNRCHMLGQLKERYCQRLHGKYTPRTHQIIEGLFQEPLVRIVDVQQNLDIAYKTARADIEVLQKVGILKRLRNQYPACFFAWEIFRIAYRDQPEYASDDEINEMIQSGSSSSSEQEPPPLLSADASLESSS